MRKRRKGPGDPPPKRARHRREPKTSGAPVTRVRRTLILAELDSYSRRVRLRLRELDMSADELASVLGWTRGTLDPTLVSPSITEERHLAICAALRVEPSDEMWTRPLRPLREMAAAPEEATRHLSARAEQAAALILESLKKNR